MKNKIIILLILFSFQVNYSQILIKLEYHKLNWMGHGVVMYYSLTSVHDLDILTCKSKSFKKERNILSSFGIPITEFAESECVKSINFFDETVEFLTEEKNNRFQIINKKNSIIITILKAEYESCSFVPTRNHWGSYDGDFKKCCVVTKLPIIDSFNDLEMITLIKIIRRLKRRI